MGDSEQPAKSTRRMETDEERQGRQRAQKEMEKQIEALRLERAALMKMADELQISGTDIQNIDPNLLHYQKSDKLVQTPVPDPLAVVTIDEIGTIAQIQILEKVFTIEIPMNENGEYDPKGKMRKFGGLPGTMAGIDRFINLTPAIDGDRAELFAQSIKPAQPTIINPYDSKEQEEGWVDKIKGFFGGLMNRGDKN